MMQPDQPGAPGSAPATPAAPATDAADGRRSRRRRLLLLAVAAGLGLLAWWYATQPRYAPGEITATDPGGRFEVKLPAGYQFAFTPGVGNGRLEFQHYEAFGPGPISEFSVMVVVDLGRRYDADITNPEVVAHAVGELKAGYGGEVLAEGTVARPSGTAQYAVVRAKLEQPATICMEAYLDGNDLVVLQTISSDANSRQDARGQRFFSSFEFKKRKLERGAPPPMPAAAPAPPSEPAPGNR